MTDVDRSSGLVDPTFVDVMHSFAVTDAGQIMFAIIITMYESRADRPVNLIYGPYSEADAFAEARRMRDEQARKGHNPSEVRVYAMVDAETPALM